MKGFGRKTVAFLAAALMLCSMVLSGCGKDLPPADETVSALYDLAVKEDPSALQEVLGFSSEEAVQEAFIEDVESYSFTKSIEEELIGSGVEFTEEELGELSGQLVSMLDKLSCTVEIVDEGDDTVTVSLTTNGYSLSDIEGVAMTAQEELFAAMDEDTQMAIALGDEEAMMNFMREFVASYVEALTQLEPTQETELEVVCERLIVEDGDKEIIAWLPSDVTQFEAELSSAIMTGM